MNDIYVGRYSSPEQVDYQGWIEPDNESWILFIDIAGEPVLFSKRDSDGVVID